MSTAFGTLLSSVVVSRELRSMLTGYVVYLFCQVSEMAVSELPGNPNAVWTVRRHIEGKRPFPTLKMRVRVPLTVQGLRDCIHNISISHLALYTRNFFWPNTMFLRLSQSGCFHILFVHIIEGCIGWLLIFSTYTLGCRGAVLCNGFCF